MAVMIAGCGAEPPDLADDRAVRVVATTTQVASVVEEIAGDVVRLTTLLAPGVEPHDFEMTPAAGAELERADLIVKSGAGLEDWLDDVLETIGDSDRVRDLSAGIDLRGDDPHYWLSGPNAIRMATNARVALLALLPNQADGIEMRAAALVARLTAADREIRALMGEIPEGSRVIVTDHDALAYFLDEYDLVSAGSVFPTLDVSSEPSAQQVQALVSAIREQGARAIFTESAANRELAQAVAAETGIHVADDPLYSDSLGPTGSGADTLDGMLLHNARVIHSALLGD